MKKLLFVHDHIFIRGQDNNIYSQGGFPKQLWSKYFDCFSKIDVIARCSDEVEVNTEPYVLSTAGNVFFHFVKKISSPKTLLKNFSSVSSIIENKVRTSEYVIARLPSENGLLAAYYAKKYKKPLLIEVVGCAWDSLWHYGGTFSKFYAFISYARTKMAIKTSDYVLYVTKEYLQEKYPANEFAKVVSASNVAINNQITVASPLYEKDYSTIKVGLIGNFKTRYKGVHTAIEAINLLNNKGVNATLYILGKGDKSEYLELAEKLGVGNKVVFCDPVPSGKPVLDWIDNIDLYIQPSLTEGLPRSLIEAMSRGRLCIGSKVGGIPELLSADFLHQPNNAEDLSNVIFNTMQKDLNEISLTNINKSKSYNQSTIYQRRLSFFNQFSNSK
ncbi:glycosyltransferase [Thalassotalea nanhaiensis]|uniref:Glycosyltransferase n=1 Tax=Thalassotalea nanhaiensis TaxID=3065648 RepID=A0ABY9TLH1_9GAMM|nr:glycosyltransferase [Colwelliaceae bacterium SQ345]